MTWPWNRPAVAVAAQPEPVLPPDSPVHVPCAACHHPMPAPMVDLQQVPGVDGTLWLCLDPAACRARAQAVGIYGQVA